MMVGSAKPIGKEPTSGYISHRRHEEALKLAGTDCVVEAPAGGPLTRLADFINTNLGWIGCLKLGIHGENYGLVTANVSPFGYNLAYVSAFRMGEDGVSKFVLLRDASEYAAEKPNGEGNTPSPTAVASPATNASPPPPTQPRPPFDSQTSAGSATGWPPPSARSNSFAFAATTLASWKCPLAPGARRLTSLCSSPATDSPRCRR